MRSRSTLAAALLTLATSCTGSHDETSSIEAFREDLGTARERTPEEEAALLPVHIHEPAILRGITTGTLTDVHGDAVPVSCASCHSLEGVVTTFPEAPEDVAGPHAGLSFAHGELACTACHDSARPDHLHLATGEVIAATRAMELCAQCHGPQYRDYRHGAHGGMRGHWDRRVGERERNHCVDCHDPHRPAFGTFTPLPPPIDRFPPASGDHHRADASHAEEHE